MISEHDKAAIIELARRYEVGAILLFGSSVRPEGVGNDIDLAVDGIPPERFFDFYGDLIFSLSKPVDLVDLRRDSRFNRLVRKEGVRLYERSA